MPHPSARSGNSGISVKAMAAVLLTLAALVAYLAFRTSLGDAAALLLAGNGRQAAVPAVVGTKPTPAVPVPRPPRPDQRHRRRARRRRSGTAKPWPGETLGATFLSSTAP